MNSFKTLALAPALQDNLASLGYSQMTPIQADSLPHILNGDDVIGKAKTGSGKTAAFGLGLLSSLDVKQFSVQALVLCPTRELADQVAKELRRLARAIPNLKVLSLCGGMPFGPQANSLAHGAHIVVGTPGRVEEHTRKRNLDLSALRCLVLDEADRMLDSGFEESLESIFKVLPQPRQTLLFSATYTDSIESLAEDITVNPRFVEAAEQHSRNTIEQCFFLVENNEAQRIISLQLLLLEYRPQSSLVFCNTKKDVNAVASALNEAGFTALPLHGDLEQKDRNNTLIQFAHRSVSILVATDVAARGLDIEQLDIVINYQLARELDVHTHRVGRTGRAGEKGLALTLYSEAEAFKFNKLVEKLASMRQTALLEQLPATDLLDQPSFKPSMATLLMDGGKKQKIRAGDILGALTANSDIQGSDVGKIAITDFKTYISVKRHIAVDALSTIRNGRVKGKNFRVRQM